MRVWTRDHEICLPGQFAYLPCDPSNCLCWSLKSPLKTTATTHLPSLPTPAPSFDPACKRKVPLHIHPRRSKFCLPTPVVDRLTAFDLGTLSVDPPTRISFHTPRPTFLLHLRTSISQPHNFTPPSPNLSFLENYRADLQPQLSRRRYTLVPVIANPAKP